MVVESEAELAKVEKRDFSVLVFGVQVADDVYQNERKNETNLEDFMSIDLKEELLK